MVINLGLEVYIGALFSGGVLFSAGIVAEDSSRERDTSRELDVEVDATDDAPDCLLSAVSSSGTAARGVKELSSNRVGD